MGYLGLWMYFAIPFLTRMSLRAELSCCKQGSNVYSRILFLRVEHFFLIVFVRLLMLNGLPNLPRLKTLSCY